MTVRTAAGARFYIGPANETADELADYTGLAYTEVGEVEDLGEFGDAWNQTTFTALSDSRVRKYKTTRDAGDANMVIGFDSGDAGQTALVAALDSKSDYAFKIVLDDGSEGSPSQGTTWYFRAKIMSNRRNVGTNDNVVRRNVTVAINSDIIEVAAV